MTGTGLPASAAIAGLLSLLVLLGPWGIGEAWPGADRLGPLALLWGAVLGLPRACRSPEAALPSIALGFGWALPALVGAWVLDGARSPVELAGAIGACAGLALAGTPVVGTAAVGRVALSWGLLIAGPWLLRELARWGGAVTPAALDALADRSPFELLARGPEAPLPLLLALHLVVVLALRRGGVNGVATASEEAET